MFQKMLQCGGGGEDKYIEYTVGFGANGYGACCGGVIGSSSSTNYIGYNGKKDKIDI